MNASQSKNLVPYLDEEYVNSKFDEFAGRQTLKDVIDLAGVDNAAIREILLHQIAYQKRHALFSFFHQGSLMDMMRQFGAVSSSTMAHKTGFYQKKRFSTAFKAAGVAGASGAAVEWTLTADYSPSATTVVNIGDIICIGKSNVQVEVIGIDPGFALPSMGKDKDGVAVTSTSMGGGAGAHIIAVVPKQNEVVPTVDGDSGLFVLSRNVGEASTTDNFFKTKLDDLYLFGSSTVRTDVEASGHANATGVAEMLVNFSDRSIKVIADINLLDAMLLHQFKVLGEFMFGQRATNTAVSDYHVKQNNGVYTQILSNGGKLINYNAGSMSFDGDIIQIFDYMSNNGIDEAVGWLAYDQYKEVQKNVAPNYWVNSLNINMDITANVGGQGMKFNWDTSCIEFGGRRLFVKQLPILQDSGTYGNAFSKTGIIIPLKTYSVVDSMSNAPRDEFAVSVKFQKDKYGRVRDEKFMWTDGGASPSQNTPRDAEGTYALTQLNVEVAGAANAIVFQAN